MVELTPRQEQVYKGLCDGMSPDEICVELRLSPFTIRNHIKALADRLPGSGPPIRKILHYALTERTNGTKG